ncbi:MAG: hypothetical protein R3313_01600 [Candidatus Saccharimonadales bacterium]|nr:hypothetical protein [Candidatus Saccharimonadales bacterium]
MTTLTATADEPALGALQTWIANVRCRRLPGRVRRVLGEEFLYRLACQYDTLTKIYASASADERRWMSAIEEVFADRGLEVSEFCPTLLCEQIRAGKKVSFDRRSA